MKKFLNSLGRGVLWAIDAFVRIYLFRGRSTKEPFEKATNEEWRYGCFFMVIFPAMMVIGPIIAGWIPNSLANYFTYNIYGEILICVIFGIVVGIGGFALIIVSQKIPLAASIPLAVISWLVCIGYFIVRFHSDWSH